MNKLEEEFAIQLRAEKIQFSREIMLIPGRRFRVDFFISPNLCIEIQGGIWRKGGHTTGSGIIRDCLKSSLLTVHGFRVLHATAEHVRSGALIGWVKASLKPAITDKVEACTPETKS